MDSIGVPSESSDRQLAERIQQYLAEQDQRVLRFQRASERRGRTAHGLVPTELDALQEILEIGSARVRRRLAERLNHASVHHLSRGIRNHEHHQRVHAVPGQRVVPFRQRGHRSRPVLSTDQQDHHQQRENVVHKRIARLQGTHDHRQERVEEIVNEQTARLEGLQLQDTVGHHPVLPPVLLSTHSRGDPFH